LSTNIINIILTILIIYLIKGHMPSPKEKTVRTNFTVLQSDLDLLTQTKKRCLLLGIETNKSELIRAGIDTLAKLSDTKLRDVLAELPKPKAGRKKLDLDSA
jgi:low affinity Fe/Cu permease